MFLVFGKSGWIGGLLGQLLKERGLKFEYANARLEDRAEVIADLERVRFQCFPFVCLQIIGKVRNTQVFGLKPLGNSLYR